MRYAVLSDIHGNLEALQAVLADAASHADDVLCLGDVVGYGADPNVLGRVLRLNEIDTPVVGVMPPEFRFPGDDTLLWVAGDVRPAQVRPGQRLRLP